MVACTFLGELAREAKVEDDGLRHGQWRMNGWMLQNEREKSGAYEDRRGCSLGRSEEMCVPLHVYVCLDCLARYTIRCSDYS